MSQSFTTRSGSKSQQRRRFQSQQQQPDTNKAELIKSQSISIELVEGDKSSNVNVDVRLAIEANMSPPQIVVEITHRDRAISMLRLPEPPNVLKLFRLYEFVTRIQKINVVETELLSQAIHEGALPQGRQFKKFRKSVGQAFEFARSFVPNGKDVLQALAHCHEFGIAVDTESLSALAAEGRFIVTRELEASGVMPPTAYRGRRTKIDQRFAEMRPQLEELCNRLEIRMSDVESHIREQIEYGVEGDLACAIIMFSIVQHSIPQMNLVMTSQGMSLVRPNCERTATEGLRQLLNWDQRRASLAERQLLGYFEQRERGMQKLETECL